MYRSLCPANRGAVENPCADGPWHQVQFRMGRDSSAANGLAKEQTITRIAILYLMSSMIRVLALSKTIHLRLLT